MQRLKEKAAAGPVATYRTLTLYGSGEVGRVKESGFGNERVGLSGVGAQVETGSALEKRVTATRLVAMGGVGGLLFKKKSGGESWLTIEGPDVFWTVEVPRGEEQKARNFAAKVNEAAKAA